jgi:hypothetical protein
VDITQLILDDHHEQRRLFAMLEEISRSDTEVLSVLWGRLAVFLELHAAAEEAIFYPALLQVGLAARRRAGVEDETLDAIHDHNDIRDAVTEVARHPVGTDDWYTVVAGANLANSDHMAEEFAAFEARNYAGVTPHDRDPAEYVREAEEDLPAPAGGSLSIGSLKKS